MSDVLCDFCRREWTDDLPMVEGHQGSCICGDCLAAAYRALAQRPAAPGADPGADPPQCILCLEKRDEPTWQAPGADAAAAHACRRCVRQSAAVLQKASEFGWRKPEP
jgi:hypothetical protein